MPTYKVTAPDGRTFRLRGAAPPTEEQLQEIFGAMQGPETPTMGPPREGEDFGGAWPDPAEEARAVEERTAKNVENPPRVMGEAAMLLAGSPVGGGLLRGAFGALRGALPLITPAQVAANAPKVAAAAEAAPAAAAGGAVGGFAKNAMIDLALESMIPGGGAMGRVLKPLAGTLLKSFGKAKTVVPAAAEAAPAAVETAPAAASAVAGGTSQALQVQKLQQLASMPGGRAIVNEWLAAQPAAERAVLRKLFESPVTRINTVPSWP